MVAAIGLLGFAKKGLVGHVTRPCEYLYSETLTRYEISEAIY